MTDDISIDQDPNQNKNTGIYKLIQIDPPESIRDAESIITSIYALIEGLDPNVIDIDDLTQFELMMIVNRIKPSFSKMPIRNLADVNEFEGQLLQFKAEVSNDLEQLTEKGKLNKWLQIAIVGYVSNFLGIDFEFIEYKRNQWGESI